VSQTAALDRAREALDRHAWEDAYETLSAASEQRRLSGEELELLAESAWWTARPQECIDASERAYAAYSREGEPNRAAYAALRLADLLSEQLSTAQATGWVQRAARLLEDRPESVEHGYLELARVKRSGSVEEMMRHATAVLDIGTRFGDRDLQAFGLMCQGMALVAQTDVEQGMSLIDEAAAAAVGGELTPFATGIVYCFTIVACMELADYRRAAEWTEATTRWCERQSIGGFPGHCRVRRAEIMRLRGAFADAEAEARHAIEELASFGEVAISGVGFHEIGEIRLRLSDLDGAEEAFEMAHQRGNTAQPGLALLQLARGHRVAARSSIRAALAEQPMPLERARLLPAQAEISLASHDVAEARQAAEELREIASSYDAPLWHASMHQALGAVLTSEGDAAGGIAELRKAVRHWAEAGLPFETAQARRWLATAHRAADDEESAVLELRAAAAAFDELGAAMEADRCRELIEAGASRTGRRVQRTFMFTDIVGSTNLLETMGDEAWEGVLRWHDDVLRRAIDAHRGEVVHTTGDGFFASFADTEDASTCAVAIQRLLAEHRRTHGFAPQVRIGLHAAEAISVGDDYTGLGVHEAARVGAVAEGSEILVTSDTVEAGSIPFPVENAREVAVKGIAEPIGVVTVVWNDRERERMRS
jgi:class 3 adenylate cyclase